MSKIIVISVDGDADYILTEFIKTMRESSNATVLERANLVEPSLPLERETKRPKEYWKPKFERIGK